MTRGLLHAQLGTGDLTAVMGCLICVCAIDLGSARRVNRPFLQGPNRLALCAHKRKALGACACVIDYALMRPIVRQNKEDVGTDKG